MENKVKISAKLNILSAIMVAVGIIALILSLVKNPERTWANVLLNNYTFLSIVIGATFFYALQNITQSGWSVMFKRIPEAIGSFMPVIAILMLIMIFGINQIYEWSNISDGNASELILHKSPYLNVPFFIIRIILFFSLWIFIIFLFRKYSMKEDELGGTIFFSKTEFLSKVFIFVMAITFSLGTFDWVMSVDATWFSTVYAFKNIVSSLYHSIAVIFLIVFILKQLGYFPEMNKFHIHDFARYLFGLGIMWAYLWFIEYLLIWFSNIPEETFYFVARRQDGWNTLFYVNIIINWVIPFLLLLPIKFDRNKYVVLFTCCLLIVGQWIDNFMQIMPGTVGIFHIGFAEMGIYIGYLGLFIFIVARTLGKTALIPKNHPYLLESKLHHF